MSRQNGYSLAEILVVCAVLTVAAAVALPSAQPVAEFRADAAASEVTQALRFARQEAMRSGAYRMLRCGPAPNQLLVYMLDTKGNVIALKHPLSKMDYTLDLAQAPAGSNVRLTGCGFQFADKTSATTLAFDANGNPVRGTGAAASQTQALTGGAIAVGTGNVTRTVTVDVTGRVTTS